MIKRQAKQNEIDKIESADKKTVFSIRKRDDENFEFYVDRLSFDDEEEIYYWSQEMLPRPHLFGSIADARTEIFTQFNDIITGK